MVVNTAQNRSSYTSEKDAIPTLDATTTLNSVLKGSTRISKSPPKHSIPLTPKVSRTSKNYTSCERSGNEKIVESSSKGCTLKNLNGGFRKFQSMRMELERYKSYNVTPDENLAEKRDDVEKEDNLPDYFQNGTENVPHGIRIKKILDYTGSKAKGSETGHDESSNIIPIQATRLYHFRPDEESSYADGITINEENHLQVVKKELGASREKTERTCALNDSNIPEQEDRVSEESTILNVLPEIDNEKETKTEETMETKETNTFRTSFEDSKPFDELTVVESELLETCETHTKDMIKEKDKNQHLVAELETSLHRKMTSFVVDSAVVEIGNENRTKIEEMTEEKETNTLHISVEEHKPFRELAVVENEVVELYEAHKNDVVKENGKNQYPVAELENDLDNKMRRFVVHSEVTKTDLNKLPEEKIKKSYQFSESEQELFDINNKLEVEIEASKVTNELLIKNHAIEKEMNMLWITELTRSLLDANTRIEEESKTSKTAMEELSIEKETNSYRTAELEQSLIDVKKKIEEESEAANIEHYVHIAKLTEEIKTYRHQIADSETSIDDVSNNLKEENRVRLEEKEKQIHELTEEKYTCNRRIYELEESLVEVEKLKTESIVHKIALDERVIDLNNVLSDKNRELDVTLAKCSTTKALHSQLEKSLHVTSTEVSSLKHSLVDKEVLVRTLTIESDMLKKKYSKVRTEIKAKDCTLHALIEEKQKLEMQVCKIQKITTESIMSQQGKLNATNNELSTGKELISGLRNDIDEKIAAMESLECEIKKLDDIVRKDTGGEKNDGKVQDLVKDFISINQEKDNMIKVLQAQIKAIKLSLNIEEDNSQKLLGHISNLELKLKESASKVNDMSNQVSTLQSLVKDKNDQVISNNEKIDVKEIIIASLERLAITQSTSVSDLEMILINVQQDKEVNENRSKQYVEKIAVLEGEISSTAIYLNKNARKNENYENLITNLRCLVTERESKICDLSKRLKTEIDITGMPLSEREVGMSMKIEQISLDALERNVYMEGQMESIRSKLDDACDQNYKKATQITIIKTELGERDAQLRNLNAKLGFVVKNSTSKIEENEKLLKKLEQSLKIAYEELRSFERQLSEANEERDEALNKVAEKKEIQNQLRIVINKLNSENQTLSDKLHQYDKQLSKKLQDAGASISSMKDFFSVLEKMIGDKDNEISEITEEFNNIKSLYEEEKKLNNEQRKSIQFMAEELEGLQFFYDKENTLNTSTILKLKNSFEEVNAKLFESKVFSDNMIKKTFKLQSAIDKISEDLLLSKNVIRKQETVIEELQAYKIG